MYRSTQCRSHLRRQNPIAIKKNEIRGGSKVKRQCPFGNQRNELTYDIWVTVTAESFGKGVMANFSHASGVLVEKGLPFFLYPLSVVMVTACPSGMLHAELILEAAILHRLQAILTSPAL